METVRERLNRLDSLIDTERANLTKLEEQKFAAEQDIASQETIVATLKEELVGLHESLEGKSKVVDQVKKGALKASKLLDQALKEIAAHVSHRRSFYLGIAEQTLFDFLE